MTGTGALRRWTIVLGMALWALSPSAGAAMTAIAAQRAINGSWSGDGARIVIDTERLQANLDPEKPFDWRALHVVDVKGNMVVFDVGTVRYFALFAGPDAMTVTSPSFEGQRALHRTPAR